MSPNPSDNNASKQSISKTKSRSKSSFWKVLCPCLSSNNSDSEGDDKTKDSYVREEFYEQKTHNEENMHEQTQTNLPVNFKLPGFYLQKSNIPMTFNQYPQFPVKNDPKLPSSNSIKFNIKKNNTLQGYLNQNRNPNIQLSKPDLHKPKHNSALQNIDYKKMQKDRKYLMHIIKQLQSMTTTDFAFLKNGQNDSKRVYPVNLLQQNKLIVLGDKKHKLLAKVTSAKLFPSVASIKRLKESLDSNQTNQKFVKKNANFNTALDRYWDRRYFLFEKFDEGIQLDEQSWYSVSPESVADYISSRINVKNTLLDAFCGAGGDSIKLAGSCTKIISNDIDPVKLKCLLNNAKIYEAQNITLSNSDFFKLDVKVDAVYLAPPWGGPDYFKIESFHPADFQPKLTDIIEKAFTLSPNIFLLLPINTNVQALAAVINEKICKKNDLKPESCVMRIEKLFYNDSFKFLLVLFGDSSIIGDVKLGDELCFIYDMFREDDQTYFKYKKLIRKVRQEHGMVNLLNYIFEAQNFLNQNDKNCTNAVPMIERFQRYLLKNCLIDARSLEKIKEEQQKEYEYDLKHRSQKNKRLREKKIKKFLEKQGKQYHEGKQNNQEAAQLSQSEEDQIPISEILKKAQNENSEVFQRKETFESNIDIQSEIHDTSQLPRRDSLRTVSMISEFHEDQLRNINHTERATTNSDISARDSIYPVQKSQDLDVSIDARSRISQESGRMMPSSAEKAMAQKWHKQQGIRFSEPMKFEKEEIKMKKVKAGTFYLEGQVEQPNQK